MGKLWFSENYRKYKSFEDVSEDLAKEKAKLDKYIKIISSDVNRFSRFKVSDPELYGKCIDLFNEKLDLCARLIRNEISKLESASTSVSTRIKSADNLTTKYYKRYSEEDDD